MISDIISKPWKARLAALPLLALSLIPLANAQEAVYLVSRTNSWEIDRGQRARFTVFNRDESSDTGWRGVIFIQVMLFDANGAVIGRCDEISIPPGESGSVDFTYDELSLAGGLTGRLQTRAEVRYRPFPIVDRSQLQVWPTASVELIDDATGYTTLLVSGGWNGTGRTTAVWVTTGTGRTVSYNPFVTVDYVEARTER